MELGERRSATTEKERTRDSDTDQTCPRACRLAAENIDPTPSVRNGLRQTGANHSPRHHIQRNGPSQLCDLISMSFRVSSRRPAVEKVSSRNDAGRALSRARTSDATQRVCSGRSAQIIERTSVEYR